jgi:rRNA maturation protein Nop10
MKHYSMALVRSSGLRLRYRVSQALQIAGGAAMLVGFFMLNRNHDVAFGVLIPTGVLLVATGFVYGILALRCPHCGLKLAWYAYSKLPAGESTRWLDQASKCPRCGSDPSPSTPRYDPDDSFEP